jgi:hypothetical protein
MILRKIILPVLFLLANSVILGQQKIVPLQSNPVLKKYISEHPDIDNEYGSKRSLGKTNSLTDSLPFFEDFTSSNIVPDPAKWIDHNVFINNGFCINPPSYNVATFDGLDKEGNAYKNTSGIGYGPADTLTSILLNFSGYKPIDNIYFSFYYQMTGYGNTPQPQDSLLLQFLTAGKKWNTIWAKAGGKSEKQFTQVLIPISSTIYLDSFFQFRFINYSDLTGNLNHWNVDYIRIDKARNANDTLVNDQAIMTSPTPFLKHYYRMPWNQYIVPGSQENDDSTSFFVRNLKTTAVQVPSKYFVFNKKTNALLSNDNYLLGALNYQKPEKISYPFLTKIDTISPFNDSVIIRSLYTASEISDVHRTNDSIYCDQVFSNYYSYDDGTAEAGYGIDFGAGQVALGFETNVADTLRAIDMYFNQALLTNSGYFFTLTVWKSIAFGGQQNIILHSQTVKSPEHDYTYRDAMGGFTRLELDTPMAIPVGKFFVGWRQSSFFMLNIGLDMNYPDNFGRANNPNMFYNVTGSWAISGFPGTVMIRPVLGKELIKPVGINKPVKKSGTLTVYPNPAHSLLYVNIEPNEKTSYTIMDMKGSMIMQSDMSSRIIDVHELNSGIYILNIFDPILNQSYTTKFVIE